MRDVADRARRGRDLWRAPGSLSFTGYVPDGVLLALAAAGAATTGLSVGVLLAAVTVLILVLVSCTQAARTRALEGGDGGTGAASVRSAGTASPEGLPGLLAASALLAAHVLAVAVCVASATSYLVSVVPAAAPHTVVAGVAAATLLAPVVGVPGRQEAGRGAGALTCVTCVSVFLYVVVTGVLVVTGLVQELGGDLGRAESADLEILAAGRGQGPAGPVGLAVVVMVLRAFCSGCAVLGGVADLSCWCPRGAGGRRGPAAAPGLLLVGAGLVVLVAIVHLAGATGVQVVEEPAAQLLRDGRPVGEGYRQDPVSVQVARAVFPGSFLVPCLAALTTGMVLLLAARAVVTGFPVLVGALGRRSLLPHQLTQLGDPVVRTRSSVVLWLSAVALLVGSQAHATRLLPLYVVATSAYLTLSQAGMVRHWTRGLTLATDPGHRQRMRRARAANAVGAVATGVTLVVVVVTTLTQGTWVVLAGAAVLSLAMVVTLRHYRRVEGETALDDPRDVRVLPSHVHAVVLASRLHQPTARALTYAQSTHPASIELLTVDMGDGSADRLVRTWEETGAVVPLTVLDSPRVEVIRPVVSYVRALRRDSPEDLVMVFLPEHLVRHWWDYVLHNLTTTRLKAALRLVPGVVVAAVPWRRDLGEPSGASASTAPGVGGGAGGQPGGKDSEEGVVDADVAARRASRRRQRRSG